MRVLRRTTLAAVGMAALLAGSAQARGAGHHQQNTRADRQAARQQARHQARQARGLNLDIADKVAESGLADTLSTAATDAIDNVGTGDLASNLATTTLPGSTDQAMDAMPVLDALPSASELPDEMPKVEDMASAFLSASGAAEKMKAAGASTGPLGGSNSEVWSAFLNAAATNLNGGSLQQYATAFTDLRDGGDVSSVINSAVPGETVPGNSLVTLKLGADFNKQLKDIKDTLTLAFGVDPEDNMSSNLGDPAWWVRTLMGAVQGKSAGMDLECAWTASADYKSANLFFPDSQSVYHLMFFPQFGPSDLALIEGEFPDSRYFSVQSYDETFSTVASLQDADVEAHEGINSFAKKTPLQIRDGKYKIVLSKDGKRGFPNELPMSVGNFSSNSLGFVIFRLYGVDPETKNKDAKLTKWGGKQPPTISLRTAGSLTPATFDQGWKTLEFCKDSNTEIANKAVNTAVNVRTHACFDSYCALLVTHPLAHPPTFYPSIHRAVWWS